MTKVDYEELRRATHNFDPAFRIGEGGSCTVFKAPVYGVVCAVKVLSSDADRWSTKQFATELELLARVHHEHLCRFFACSTNGPRKCLLLEYMDMSLDKRLVAEPIQPSLHDSPSRYL